MILQKNELIPQAHTVSFVKNVADSLRETFPDFHDAVVNISNLPDQKHNLPTLRKNRIFQVYERYFSPEFEWIGPRITLTKEAYSSQEKIDESVEHILSILQPVYEVADQILNAEILGMNAHDVDSHIREVLKHYKQLLSLSAQKTGASLSLKEQYTGLLTVLFHDLAQGITGRKYHAKIGRLLVEQILVATDLETKNIVQHVATFVGTHVTADYQYDISHMHPESKVYAAMVLADESDIQRTRVTETGNMLLERGEIKEKGDIWIFLNYLVLSSEWHIEQHSPSWRLKIDLSQHCVDLLKKISAFKEGNADITEVNLQAYFVDFFTREVVNGIKINLFKSAITKIFDNPEFKIHLVDQHENDVLIYYFGRSSTHLASDMRNKNQD